MRRHPRSTSLVVVYVLAVACLGSVGAADDRFEWVYWAALPMVVWFLLLMYYAVLLPATALLYYLVITPLVALFPTLHSTPVPDGVIDVALGALLYGGAALANAASLMAAATGLQGRCRRAVSTTGSAGRGETGHLRRPDIGIDPMLIIVGAVLLMVGFWIRRPGGRPWCTIPGTPIPTPPARGGEAATPTVTPARHRRLQRLS